MYECVCVCVCLCVCVCVHLYLRSCVCAGGLPETEPVGEACPRFWPLTERNGAKGGAPELMGLPIENAPAAGSLASCADDLPGTRLQPAPRGHWRLLRGPQQRHLFQPAGPQVSRTARARRDKGSCVCAPHRASQDRASVCANVELKIRLA